MPNPNLTKIYAEDERMCVCGDPESQHIDNCEQCVVPGCGCKEFEHVCEFCNGTGEVPTYYRGEDTGYNYIEDGTKKCICRIEREEADKADEAWKERD